MKHWTISAYHSWKDCGLRFALEREPTSVLGRFKGWTVARLPKRVDHPNALRGTEIHEIFEDYLKNDERPRSDHPHIKEFREWQDYLDDLKKRIANAFAGGTEVLWSFDNEWYPIESGRSSMREAVWHRQKLDAWHVDKVGVDFEADIYDYKTGKVYPDKHAEAMEVYALGVFALFEDVSRVRTHLAYIDIKNDNPISTKEFTRGDTQRLAKRWEGRAQAFLTDERFEARPSYYCGGCQFNAKNGGPCQAAPKGRR